MINSVKSKDDEYTYSHFIIYFAEELILNMEKYDIKDAETIFYAIIFLKTVDRNTEKLKILEKNLLDSKGRRTDLYKKIYDIFKKINIKKDNAYDIYIKIKDYINDNTHFKPSNETLEKETVGDLFFYSLLDIYFTYLLRKNYDERLITTEKFINSFSITDREILEGLKVFKGENIEFKSPFLKKYDRIKKALLLHFQHDKISKDSDDKNSENSKFKILELYRNYLIYSKAISENFLKFSDFLAENNVLSPSYEYLREIFYISTVLYIIGFDKSAILNESQFADYMKKVFDEDKFFLMVINKKVEEKIESILSNDYKESKLWSKVSKILLTIFNPLGMAFPSYSFFMWGLYITFLILTNYISPYLSLSINLLFPITIPILIYLILDSIILDIFILSFYRNRLFKNRKS